MWKRTKDDSEESHTPSVLNTKAFWLQNTVMYSVWPVLHLMKGFTVDPATKVTSLDVVTWNLASLLQTTGIFSLGTIVFVVVLAFIKVVVLDEVPQKSEIT